MTTSQLAPPSALCLQGTVSKNWKDFIRSYDIYAIASGVATQDEEVQCNVFLHVAGPEAQRVHATMNIPSGELNKIGPLKEHFRKFCEGKTNIIVTRYTFNSAKQNCGETFNQYYTRSRHLAQDCNYGSLEDELLRDRLVCGISDDKTRAKLLQADSLTLQKCLDICRVSESSTAQVKTLNQAPNTSNANVDIVKPKKKFSNHRVQMLSSPCSNCATKHEAKRTSCPAYNKQCHSCNKLHHFAKCCKSKGKQHTGKPLQKNLNYKKSKGAVHALEPDFLIESIEDNAHKTELHSTLSVNGTEFEVKIDTGAKCNVICHDLFKSIASSEDLNISQQTQLIAFGGSTLTTLGSTELNCLVPSIGSEYLIKFHVVDTPVCSILGLNDSLKLGLIQTSSHVHEIQNSESNTGIPQDIMDSHPSLFDGKLGKLPVIYKMRLDPDIAPVVQSARNIPVALKPKVKEKLEQMCRQEVICPVSEPTEWVSAMVVAQKPNKDIRVCIDPHHLNKALLRPRHPLRTVEQVTADMPNAKVFSTLDVTSGFWTIPLDKQSSLKTTFATPFGRFRFLRMPFGITTGSEVYQQAMEHVFANYPCQIIIDDILVYGRDMKEHDQNLEIVLRRAEEVGLKLNTRKCKIRVSEVKYVGHVLSSSGLKPDPSKIEAINSMPQPHDKPALQRFLGTVNYLAKFIPNQSDLTSPLRELLHKDTAWKWMPHHQAAFEKLKNVLTCAPVLQYFDVKSPVVITCDASQHGLGAACLQNGRPIAYASRALTATECKYAQIEKELLAVVFACSKFNDFVYGQNFQVESDHQPLISIIKKPIHSAPTRLQKMLMRLQKYNFELIYRKGKDLILADALSRAHLDNSSCASNLSNDEYEVVTCRPISDSASDKLSEATKADPDLQKLRQTILNGWPSKPNSVHPSIRPYFAVRDELALNDDIIMRGERAVVPESLRSDYIRQIHSGHPGLEASKRRARTAVYWPSLMTDLENLINECSTCLSLKPHQQKEPMESHPTPALPWSMLSADIFEWNSLHYLVVVDSYSNWFEFDSLTDMTSRTVIKKLKRQFATHGIPKSLLTDNARQFTSEEFRLFANQYGFTHYTSSPTYPQSNGLAERAVQSAKRLLEKTKRDNSDLFLNLLNLRNIPREGEIGSPAQRMFSRVTRYTLPTTDKVLEPKTLNCAKVQKAIIKKKNQQKSSYDKSAKSLPTLNPGQSVRMQTPIGYDRTAVIKETHNAPRSYIVTSNGHDYRRNRRHLLPTSEPHSDSHLPESYSPDYSSDPETPPSSPCSVRAPLTPPTSFENLTAQQPTSQARSVSPTKVTRSGRVSKPNPKYQGWAK